MQRDELHRMEALQARMRVTSKPTAPSGPLFRDAAASLESVRGE